ncbi:MAG: restriction endonuclease subunit S [bacterium]
MWIKERIDTVADIISGGTPARDNPKYWGKGCLWVTPTDITKCTGNYIDNSEEEITLDGLRNSSAKLLPKGTILLTSRATIGEAKIATREMTTNQGFKSLKANNRINNVFLYYQILLNKNLFERFAVGSTFPEINKPDTSRILIDYTPNIKEQQKIATILETIDTAIEKTEELINKYEQIKEGMMQDLFTRSVDKNSKLRPTYQEAPELYKSELGLLIPKDWIVAIMEKIATINMGQSPSSTTYNEKNIGLPFLQGCGNFGQINPNTNVFCSSPLKTTNCNEILLSVRAPVGMINLADQKYCIGRGLAAICGLDVTTIYLFYYMLLNSNKLEKLGQGSTFTAIGSRELKNFIVGFPKTKEEQNRIVSVLTSHDLLIKCEIKNKEKLQQQKQGLMQDLLTGKVRVKLEEESK